MVDDKEQVNQEATEYTIKQKAEEEGWKLHFDALKHLTTLCTGSILILVAFLEKIFANPSWKWLIATTLILFVLSIVTSMISIVMIASTVRDVTSVRGVEREKILKELINWAASSYVLFSVGIICLVVFSIKNLYF